MFKHSKSNFSHFISWGRTSSGFESLLKSLCFCAQKERQDAILQFHLKNQMNKQSALMNIVPELHKSRDSLLSASAQRYFAGNLHHNAWLPIGLDLIKQTRGSAFFYRFHFQWWLDLFLSKNNIILQLSNREHSSSNCSISSALPSIFWHVCGNDPFCESRDVSVAWLRTAGMDMSHKPRARPHLDLRTLLCIWPGGDPGSSHFWLWNFGLILRK